MLLLYHSYYDLESDKYTDLKQKLATMCDIHTLLIQVVLSGHIRIEVASSEHIRIIIIICSPVCVSSVPPTSFVVGTH